MKCVNMSLFQKTLDLGTILMNKSSIGTMKDNYALILFSWNTLVQLLHEKWFDGAFYVLPFTYMLLAIPSKNLNKSDRIELILCE